MRLQPATPEGIWWTGAEPSHAFPVGIDRAGVTVVVDALVPVLPYPMDGRTIRGGIS